MIFEAAARRCAEGAAELAAEVRALGGDPERSGSATGSLHRGWINIKCGKRIDIQDRYLRLEQSRAVAFRHISALLILWRRRNFSPLAQTLCLHSLLSSMK